MVRMEQQDASGNGTITEFKRDAGGRILERKQSKLTNGVSSIVSQAKYGYTTAGDSPDIITNMTGGLLRKVYSLPGGVTLSTNPTESLQSKQRTYSIPNFHGDTMVTTDYFGVKTGVTTYDPFGNVLDSVLPQNNSAPGTAKGYLGQFNRLTESDFTIPIINMGDRVYLPGLGRFMQPDPVEGGNANSYIYPADPVNSRDVDGNFAWFAPVAWFVARAVVSYVVLWVIGKAIQKVVPPPYRASAETVVAIASFASPGRAASSAASKAPLYVPKALKQVKNVFGSSIFKYQPQKGWRGTTMDTPTSLKYHYAEHGAGKLESQYFEDAKNFAKNPTGTRQTVMQLKDGTNATKYRTKGSQGGIIDEYGNIISFWYD